MYKNVWQNPLKGTFRRKSKFLQNYFTLRQLEFFLNVDNLKIDNNELLIYLFIKFCKPFVLSIQFSGRRCVFAVVGASSDHVHMVAVRI